jgi:hypothetical protein
MLDVLFNFRCIATALQKWYKYFIFSIHSLSISCNFFVCMFMKWYYIEKCNWMNTGIWLVICRKKCRYFEICERVRSEIAQKTFQLKFLNSASFISLATTTKLKQKANNIKFLMIHIAQPRNAQFFHKATENFRWAFNLCFLRTLKSCCRSNLR